MSSLHGKLQLPFEEGQYFEDESSGVTPSTRQLAGEAQTPTEDSKNDLVFAK